MYKIIDWAGNELSKHGKFNSFEDAWDYIYQNFDEANFEELYVTK